MNLLNFLKLKEFIGVLVFDVHRYLSLLCSTGGWHHICNRREVVSLNLNGPGVLCHWKWSSILHAPTVLPFLGKWLMMRALSEYSVKLSGESSVCFSGVPEVSFIVGHRGQNRLPQLLFILNSIAGQIGINVECIVVEQDYCENIRDRLPTWVKYVFDQSNCDSYNRARAFNRGAEIASGTLLIFHDNDLVAPSSYAKEAFKEFCDGFQVIDLKRMIFYLREEVTSKILSCGYLNFKNTPGSIVQNARPGGSLAVCRNTFFDLGCYDEAFHGWGGEDVEFWERAQTAIVNQYTYIPFVHLWHEDQPEKNHQKDSDAMMRWERLSRMDVYKRIDRLKK